MKAVVTLVNGNGCSLGSWDIITKNEDGVTKAVINLLQDEHIVLVPGDHLVIEGE